MGFTAVAAIGAVVVSTDGVGNAEALTAGVLKVADADSTDEAASLVAVVSRAARLAVGSTMEAAGSAAVAAVASTVVAAVASTVVAAVASTAVVAAMVAAIGN